MVRRLTDFRSFLTLRTTLLVLGAFLILAAGMLSYRIALQRELENQSGVARERLMLFSRTLDYTVGRYSYLPDVLSQAPPIIEAYRNPADPAAIQAANLYLKSLNEAANAIALYIVDRDGITLAASNFDSEATFVGQNYAFRPYITDAAHGEGRFYAVGVTTGQPGYFLWHSVNGANGDVLGVVVVKIDLLHLQRDWGSTGDLVAMVDSNRVIFLTTNADWMYRPMHPLTAQQIETLRETQQYGGAVLRARPLLAGARTLNGFPVQRVADGTDGGEYVAFSRNMRDYGWTLYILTDLSSIQSRVGVAAGGAVATVVAALLVLLVTMQRRQIMRAKQSAHNVLEQRVAIRTAELTEANARLSNEIDQRIRTEQNLRRAQDNLIHATKMASLGQALAGVAHEINQSLAALRTYIASTQLLLSRGDKESASSNLVTVSVIVERMGELTQHLKSFARKETVTKQSTDLVAALRSGLKLIEYRLSAVDVQLKVKVPSHPVYVMGNTIRLEQVVVNLIANALDAMSGVPNGQLTVELHTAGHEVVLEVSDTGLGIPRETLSRVFDPFYTTKEVGEGLGLGLSISYGIIKDMGGDISVESEANCGTTFRVALPLVAQVISRVEVSA